ncbi:MAG: PASTA domain-containing protein [Phycisphaerales bacterium]
MNKRISIALAAAFVVSLLAMAAPAQDIMVPDVVGMNETDAGSAISSASLTMGFPSYACDNTVPAGLIISQSPSAGTLVSITTWVNVVVSTGPCEVTVPDITGVLLLDAGQALYGHHLVVGSVTWVCDDTATDGQIIGQSPSAGSIVPWDSSVDVVVSSGPCTTDVEVPDINGNTEFWAEYALDVCGLTLGSVTYVCNNTVMAGVVISQSPSAGSMVPVGSSVDVVITTGPCTGNEVTVPDVVGMSEDDAGTRIRSAGFTISWTHQYSDTVPEGHVISQDPQGGTSAPEGSDVSLVLSLGPQHDPSVEPDANCLIAHWKLDETEGEIAYDSVGINDGFLMGDPQWSAGVLDGALDFDGDGDYVDCGTSAALNSLSDVMTCSSWVNIRSITTTWMAIVAKGETAWRLSVNGDTTGIHFGFTGGDRGWQGANSVTELPLDEWHHIAGVYDSGVGAIIYIDGVAEANNPDLDGVAMNEMPFLLGENPESAGRFLDGILDDVRIYECALSVYEILYLASGQMEPDESDVNGLVAHYALENNSYDSSDNMFDGVIMGNPNFVEGMAGMAIDLDGDGDYVDCGTSEELNSLSEKMTVATWVNIRSITTAWMAIAGKGETAWRLSINNDTTGIHFGFTGGTRGWQSADSVTELPLGEWHHVAGVYDNEVGGTIYIDGVAETVNPDLGGTDTNEMPFLLGENPESAGRFLDGMLDEVMIYNRALSAGEISSLADF